MAKTMARIEDGIVVNIEWHPDYRAPSDILVDPGERPVTIGDTYDGADFWHNGIRVLTPLEAARLEAEKLREENQSLIAQQEAMLAAYAEGVASA